MVERQLLLPEDPRLGRFLKMKKAGLPQGAVENAMIKANIDPASLYGDNLVTTGAREPTLAVGGAKTVQPMKRAPSRTSKSRSRNNGRGDPVSRSSKSRSRSRKSSSKTRNGGAGKEITRQPMQARGKAVSKNPGYGNKQRSPSPSRNRADSRNRTRQMVSPRKPAQSKVQPIGGNSIEKVMTRRMDTDRPSARSKQPSVQPMERGFSAVGDELAKFRIPTTVAAPAAVSQPDPVRGFSAVGDELAKFRIPTTVGAVAPNSNAQNNQISNLRSPPTTKPEEPGGKFRSGQTLDMRNDRRLSEESFPDAIVPVDTSVGKIRPMRASKIPAADRSDNNIFSTRMKLAAGQADAVNSNAFGDIADAIVPTPGKGNTAKGKRKKKKKKAPNGMFAMFQRSTIHKETPKKYRAPQRPAVPSPFPSSARSFVEMKAAGGTAPGPMDSRGAVNTARPMNPMTTAPASSPYKKKSRAVKKVEDRSFAGNREDFTQETQEAQFLTPNQQPMQSEFSNQIDTLDVQSTEEDFGVTPGGFLTGDLLTESARKLNRVERNSEVTRPNASVRPKKNEALFNSTSQQISNIQNMMMKNQTIIGSQNRDGAYTRKMKELEDISARRAQLSEDTGSIRDSGFSSVGGGDVAELWKPNYVTANQNLRTSQQVGLMSMKRPEKQMTVRPLTLAVDAGTFSPKKATVRVPPPVKEEEVSLPEPVVNDESPDSAEKNSDAAPSLDSPKRSVADIKNRFNNFAATSAAKVPMPAAPVVARKPSAESAEKISGENTDRTSSFASAKNMFGGQGRMSNQSRQSAQSNGSQQSQKSKQSATEVNAGARMSNQSNGSAASGQSETSVPSILDMSTPGMTRMDSARAPAPSLIKGAPAGTKASILNGGAAAASNNRVSEYWGQPLGNSGQKKKRVLTGFGAKDDTDAESSVMGRVAARTQQPSILKKPVSEFGRASSVASSKSKTRAVTSFGRKSSSSSAKGKSLVPLERSNSVQSRVSKFSGNGSKPLEPLQRRPTAGSTSMKLKSPMPGRTSFQRSTVAKPESPMAGRTSFQRSTVAKPSGTTSFGQQSQRVSVASAEFPLGASSAPLPSQRISAASVKRESIESKASALDQAEMEAERASKAVDVVLRSPMNNVASPRAGVDENFFVSTLMPQNSPLETGNPSGLPTPPMARARSTGMSSSISAIAAGNPKFPAPNPGDRMTALSAASGASGSSSSSSRSSSSSGSSRSFSSASSAGSDDQDWRETRTML